ncbi:hypothetical protein QWY75_07720 [Pontixanthobacter aestiaquae]|uniref:Uncharacterized protein n=1 Tax=Pontixanthobacter aestiaquae TaxID=1509367 RepID=A0A844Z6P3_9SPHN|nr:hypothetical protein [Pontixanthobacter aestiaquae]MDN3646092.1 hypothetical protein [Pontixanthobacter aestiaquae]MXO82916.1 hypothetical protein [Pontixanthobacter aestiaquae]
MVARTALAAVFLIGAQPAFAQAERYIAQDARTVEPARQIASIIPQDRIASSIELGRIVPNEGGLIGALVDRTPEKLAQNAAMKADRFIRPLAEVLEGFDAAKLARSATENALAQADWFAAGPPNVLTGTSISTTRTEKNGGSDSTVSMTFAVGAFATEANDTVGALTWEKERRRLERDFAAAHSSASELAVITWRYQLSADFTNMQVIADIATRKPNLPDRLFKQQLISIVKLRRPSFVEEDNVAIWAGNDGAIARTALEMAFSRVGEVLPAVLALDAKGYRAATSKKNRQTATAAGFYGPQLLRDDKGPVFHARDGDQRLRAFVAVQTIRN